MTILVILGTLFLIFLCGWISSLILMLGFGPFFVRLLYSYLGLKAISMIPDQFSLKLSFYIISFLTALFFYRGANKKINNGDFLSRVIPDVKGSMFFFIISITLGFGIFLFKNFI